MSIERAAHPFDPRRRVRRHHYQEGPGFLFLSTQGGRPIEVEARTSLAVVRIRMRAVRRAQEVGISVACVELGCPRRSLYRWLGAFQTNGIAGLVPQSRRPKRLRETVPAWVETVVIMIRLQTYWNSKRIAAEMSRRGIYTVGHTYIDGLFKAQGCARGSVSPEPGPRYERTRPNELWHIDIKGPFFIRLRGQGYIKTWLVGLIDDHSRFVIGLRIHTDYKLEPILKWLDDCFELCGQPLELMSDNGKPFVGWMPGLLSGFGKRLRELHVLHLRTQINTPWTNGKIEAFWDVLQAEVLDRQLFASLAEAEAALATFAHYYNFHRLSGTLDWLTPAERYDGTPFTDRGFEHIPGLAHLQPWLEELMHAA
jgi:transposase InsO family protein